MSTSARALTAPNDLLIPRRLSCGWAESVAIVWPACSIRLLDSGGCAGALGRRHADVGHLGEPVLDDRGLDVLGGHPGGRQVHGRDVGVGLGVLGRGV